MDDQTGGSLISALDAMFGGAATSMIAAIIGRLAYHASEVRKGRRQRFLGIELLWEAPIAVGMALVGESLSDFFELGHNVSIGVVAVLAYLGPRGAQSLADAWLKRSEK